MNKFSRESLFPFNKAIQKEWLAVNGMGGFSALALNGARSRYYHGLLVAALSPPVRRFLLLANLHEEIKLDNEKIVLSNSDQVELKNNIGSKYLHQINLDPVPEYTFRFGSDFLSKTILPIYGSNSVLINYKWNGEENIRLKIKPLCTFRDFHGLEKRELPKIEFSSDNEMQLVVTGKLGKYQVASNKGRYTNYPQPQVIKDFYYQKEVERGFNGLEDIYIPGEFIIDLKPGEEVTIQAGLDMEEHIDFNSMYNAEKERQEKIIQNAAAKTELHQQLALAADKFLVYRESTGKMSLLAGFPWFTDWGRDTMISLPGITLSTGREHAATELLETFCDSIKHGLIPNRFSDYDGDEAEYNTVDASFWFFVGVLNFFDKTDNSELVISKFLPAMDQIIEKHISGTIYNIKMDATDKLITAGEKGTQLTWMDAKVDGIVMTPRHGKAVEINALWYNALMIRDSIAKRVEQKAKYSDLANEVYTNFRDKFWNEKGQYLFDVITDKKIDKKIRPNQIFALSLPFPLFEGDKAKAILQNVTEHLLTPYGLRSLSPQDKEFLGDFSGDRYKRDAAYHQGTVWSWLIGPYVFAYLFVNGFEKKQLENVVEIITPLLLHLNEDGIGCISENFDGLFPLEGKGCFHQAWSVAELLRIRDILEEKGLKEPF